MPRFFVDIKLVSPSSVALDVSDLLKLLAIREQGSEFEVEMTTFDFSINIVDRRANNRIHTQFTTKPHIDGFIQNVLRPGCYCREVAEEQYKMFYELLVAKSNQLKRKRRRQQVISESRDDGHTKLP
jgi:hypothetical protein